MNDLREAIIEDIRARAGGHQGTRLAAELDEANRRFIALVHGLTADEWEMRGGNAPGWKFDSGEDEARTIGQIALHTANQHLVQMRIVCAVALGESPAPPGESSPQANAREAAENPHPNKDDVLRLLAENGAAGAAMLRRLTDEDLARRMTFRGWTMSAGQLAAQSQIGHVRWHTASIEEALKAGPQVS